MKDPIRMLSVKAIMENGSFRNIKNQARNILNGGIISKKQTRCFFIKCGVSILRVLTVRNCQYSYERAGDFLQYWLVGK